MNLKHLLRFLLVFSIFSSRSYAADTAVEVVNWYSVVLAKVILFFNSHLTFEYALEKARFWSPVLSSCFVVLLILFFSIFSGFWKLNPEKMSDEDLLPPKKFGLIAFFELCWSVISSTLESTIGDKNWTRFVNVLGGTFFVLIISNLSGILPGFEPATANMSFSFAGAFIIFIYFNFYGFKESGFDYVKHLAGPVLWMAPLMFVIEFISLLSRPVSLSLRIFGNVSGDHFVFSIFSNLMKELSIPFVPIPAIFLAFGTFVACLQAFIFMTLSAVYIRLALDSKVHH